MSKQTEKTLFKSRFKIFKHKHGWTGLNTSSPIVDILEVVLVMAMATTFDILSTGCCLLVSLQWFIRMTALVTAIVLFYGYGFDV